MVCYANPRCFTMRKVTRASIYERIQSVQYHQWPGTTVTECLITLDNGFSVNGQSACVDPKLFERNLGERLAYDNAFNRIWQLEAYLLAEELFRDERRADAMSGFGMQAVWVADSVQAYADKDGNSHPISQAREVA